MNSLQVTYFLALCKYNNFTETARRLYVSQPAISKQILALEEELGVSLFKREYKNIYLTEEGKILQQTLEQSVQMMQEAKAKMYQQSHPQECPLKIAVLQGIEIADTLRPILQQFMFQHPHINVSLECLSHEKLNSMLRLNELDLAITLAREARNDKLLKTVNIFSAGLAFTVHESHPLYKTERITSKELENQSILVTTAGAKGFSSFLNLLQSYYHIKPTQFVYLASLDEVIFYMSSGAGIAVIAEQNRFSGRHYRQFPLKDVSEIITGAWYYNNFNPARKLLLDELIKP